MTNTKDVILQLKKVKEEKGLSLDKILLLVENNGEYISKSTIARVFKEGSENKSFRYEETLRPIANALLDIETIEEEDDDETKAYKAILKLKMELMNEYEKKIQELEAQIEDVANNEKLKYHDKLEKYNAQHQRSVEFLKNQIELKDKRIDLLMDANERLSVTNNQLLNQFLECPLKNQECHK